MDSPWLGATKMKKIKIKIKIERESAKRRDFEFGAKDYLTYTLQFFNFSKFKFDFGKGK